MNGEKPGLDDAYALNTPADSRALYSSWAETYDQDFAARMNYQMPALVARAYADAGGVGPVLDIGAGTGLVAAELERLGIAPVDATDIAPEMLEIARGKALYRTLFVSDVSQSLDLPDGAYQGIVSAGTFTLGHVGPDALDELLRITAPGGLLAIGVNRAHFQVGGFADKLSSLAGAVAPPELRQALIYGSGAQGAHAGDTALIVLMRRV